MGAIKIPSFSEKKAYKDTKFINSENVMYLLVLAGVTTYSKVKTRQPKREKLLNLRRPELLLRTTLCPKKIIEPLLLRNTSMITCFYISNTEACECFPFVQSVIITELPKR